MFRRVLVANRGEIAVRILRACKELGIETVAVYSTEDRDAAYLSLADESVCIGPAASALSYLDVSRIIAAAEITDVEAIHPGYGFLAENAHFAEVCRSCGIAFIGPTPEALASLGDKARARVLAMEAGIPVVPGSEGLVETLDEALEVVRRVGFPVMLKAALGGGGRGMRVATDEEGLAGAFQAARMEAEAAFKSGAVYLESYVERPRHVEVQVLADHHGQIIHLGERDCSAQRRHQKLIEESPSPAVDEALRGRMGEAAVRLARNAGYTNAGTVEFLLHADGSFYFMEMNARIQVEHPVTEAVTGVDLVQAQIRVAAGEPLGLKQDDVRLVGHAIECRVNAEDPENGFKPSPGKITRFIPPGGPGVRLDTHAYCGYRISPAYDSLIAKLIVHRPDRDGAIVALRQAIAEFRIEGVKTTLPLFQDVLSHQHFIDGSIDTRFIEEFFVG